MRSFDYELLRPHLDKYPEMFSKMDMKAWLENKNNIMLECDGSIGLGTMEYPGVYTGHYLFAHKGKDAVRVAKKMLAWMFDNGTKVMRGETPVDNRPALMMNRLLGFKSYGVNESPKWGLHEHFMLTAEEFKENNNG